MTDPSNKGNNPLGRVIPTVIKTGLLAGTLDIAAAFLYSYIKRGTSPQAVLQYISKAAFGKDRFTDTVVLTTTGLLVHFGIAMCWTILFFILYRGLRLAMLNRLITGILYGLFVWVMMNMLILPSWNKRPFRFDWESSTINALILVLAIGMPLSFMAYNYFSKRTTRQHGNR